MTLESSLNTKPNNMLCIYLGFSCEAVMHTRISRDIFPNEISRDIFTLFCLVCTKDKLSGPDILNNSWPQRVDKMIKVSASICHTLGELYVKQNKKSRVTLSVTIEFFKCCFIVFINKEQHNFLIFTNDFISHPMTCI
jgi:hypothetical protein